MTKLSKETAQWLDDNCREGTVLRNYDPNTSSYDIEQCQWCDERAALTHKEQDDA